jgi:RimJ/RimL family protein N-acetyltransferase
MDRELREVRDEDLPFLFEQWADQVAIQMAAITAPDHMDRDAFVRRWSRLRADETVLNRVIVVDGEVAGTIGSWGEPGEREVTYWIGRSYWGRGIATYALDAFLSTERSRPLHAPVAADNVASRRVLEKCGFRTIATERNIAEARSAEVEELVLRLDELASTDLEIRLWSRGRRCRSHAMSRRREESGWLSDAGVGDAPVGGSGARCYSPKLDAGNGDSGRGPTAEWRSGLACLFLGLEQDDREALAIRRL